MTINPTNSDKSKVNTMATVSNTTSTPPLPVNSTPAIKPNIGAPTNDVATSTNNATNAGAASGTATASATASSSVTTLSTISTQLQAAQAASSSDAVFSTSKVNEIKLAISEGRFQVNSAKVADGLLDSVHDLLNSRRQSN